MNDKPDKWAAFPRQVVPQNIGNILHRPSIRKDKDGKHMIELRPGFEVQAQKTEVFFWQQAKDLRSLLSGNLLQGYVDEHGGRSDNTRYDLRDFAEWVLKTAEKAAEIRLQKRQKDIVEVREQCGLDPVTGKDLENS